MIDGGSPISENFHLKIGDGMVAIGKLQDFIATAIMTIGISGKLCGPCQTEMPLHIKHRPKRCKKRQKINVSKVHCWKIEMNEERNFKFWRAYVIIEIWHAKS